MTEPTLTGVQVTEWRSRVGEAEEAYKRTMEARRNRVLAHPDIAERLTKPPFGYATPAEWTGYLPPAEIACCLRCDLRDMLKPNRSPMRRALIDIMNAVVAREAEAA